MNGEYTKILSQIKVALQNIDGSLYSLAENIDKLTKQILKESKKDDE